MQLRVLPSQNWVTRLLRGRLECRTKSNHLWLRMREHLLSLGLQTTVQL
jgi:hypothetical protein